jgi:hypothetical protein
VQWLKPVIPATWEVEIERLVVPKQPRQTLQDYLKNNKAEKGLGHGSNGGRVVD